MVTLDFAYLLGIFLVLFNVVRNDNYGRNKSCGTIYLSIGAKSRKLTMNWYYYKCAKVPDYLVLHKMTDKPAQDDTIETMKVKSKYGSYETEELWNSNRYPGEWSFKNPRPEQKTHICSTYYIASYKRRVREDTQCLRVNPNWMMRFPNLRLYNIFLPGTRYSGAFRRYQNYDFWGQLVFGIRYFDIKIGVYREGAKKNSRYLVTNRAKSMPDELKKVETFLRRTTNEVIVLDFRKFIDFLDDSDHDILVWHLKKHFRNAMAPVNMSVVKGGPTLKSLWKRGYRIIVNYRHPPTVKRYDFLWNHISNKDCTNDDDAKVRECLGELRQHENLKVSCSVIAAMKSSNDSFPVNTNLSRWIFTDELQQHINIMTVDYFESSNIILDAIEANLKKHG